MVAANLDFRLANLTVDVLTIEIPLDSFARLNTMRTICSIVTVLSQYDTCCNLHLLQLVPVSHMPVLFCRYCFKNNTESKRIYEEGNTSSLRFKEMVKKNITYI